MTDLSQGPRPDASGSDAESLDTRILHAERAVIERDQRVRRRAGEISARLQAGAGRKLAIGAAAVGGGLILAGFLRGRWRDRHPPRHARVASTSRGPSTGWIAGLLTLALPFLPAKWQTRLSPGGRAAMVGLLLPLVSRLFGAGRSEPLPMTAGFVDLERYAGDWYEIARLPAAVESPCASDATAHYRWLGDRMEVVNRCRDRDGRDISVHGEARVVDLHTHARLEVSFAPLLLRSLPFMWADYWVLDVDPDYRHALVGTPDRESLWLLSRSPRMPADEVARLLAHAQRQGFDTGRVQRTPHLLTGGEFDDRDEDDDERLPPSRRSEAEAAGVLLR